jgi:hypothetical protein
MAKKNILIVSFFYPPINMVATDRAVKFVDELLERGFRVSLITNSHRGLAEKFADFTQDIEHPNLQIYRVPFMKYTEPNFLYDKKYNLIARVLSISFVAFIFRMFYDWGIGWNRGVSKMAEKIILDDKPHIIFSTGAPFTPFWPLSRLSRKYRIPLVLDYRDLWSESPVGLGPLANRFIARFIEKKVNKQATLITTVSEGCAQIINAATVHAQSKVKVLYNFPSHKYRDWLLSIQAKHAPAPAPQTGKLKLIYAGSMYPNADFGAILNAISLLSKEELEKLQFTYCGLAGRQVRSQFKQFGLETIFYDKGYLTKEDTVKELLDSDMMISVVKNADFTNDPIISGIITTKIFDYIILNKRVLNICPKGAELLTLIQRYQLKNIHSFTSSETLRIKEFIQQMLSEGHLSPIPVTDSPLKWESQDFSWFDNL